MVIQALVRGELSCPLTGCTSGITSNNWRASEASETLSGVTNGNLIYIYMVRARHFSSVGPVLRNVGGVKCQPFLKRSNYW